MDWNDDGLKDLLVGEYSGKVRYFRNIGSPGNPQLTFAGYVQAGGVDIDIGQYSQPWVDDWNEDGLIDLLVGESDGVVNLFINVGTNQNPVFNAGQYVTLATGAQVDFGSRSGPIVVDLNGDGVKDLISGEYSGKIYYCQNNGTNANPQLAAPVALATGTIDIDGGSTTRIAVVDWDDDGITDIVSGAYDSRLKRYMQVATTPPAPVCDVVLTSGYYIPASGGTLNFTISAVNQTGSTVYFDVWTEVKLPTNEFYSPLLYRPDVYLSPYGQVSRNLTQAVPGTAPGGSYYYYGYLGDYDNLQVYSSDDFYFYKMGDGDGETGFGSWFCRGWNDDDVAENDLVVPRTVSLQASPNPFNPTTTLTYALPQAGRVSLAIYNAAGSKVAQLVDGYRSQGAHEVTWVATDLPTGVYLVHLQTKTAQSVAKVLLIK